MLRSWFILFEFSPTGQSMRDEVVARLASATHFTVPMGDMAGVRVIGEAWFAPDATRRAAGFSEPVRTL